MKKPRPHRESLEQFNLSDSRSQSPQVHRNAARLPANAVRQMRKRGIAESEGEVSNENEVMVHEPQPTAQSVTPMQMIAVAVQQGADVQRMAQLFDLQLRWEQNEAKKAFTQAMADFKREPPVIEKSRQVSFGAGKTSYKHATLDDAASIIGEALARVGISASWDTQQTEKQAIRVTCILTHSAGHSERVTLEATPDTSGSKNSIQAIGSTVTYLQRYTLFAATGVAPKGIDNDGRETPQGLDATRLDAMLQEVADIADRKHADALWARLSAELNAAGDIPAYEQVKKALSGRVKSFPKEAA